MNEFRNDSKSPGPATEAPPVSEDEDTVVLLTGGRNDVDGAGGYLSSSEVFPSASTCTTLPALPAPRSYHALFTTPDPNPIIAACGGTDGSFNEFASCLVLDVENQRWDENTMGPLPQPRYSHAVVTLKNIGNYLIGGQPSSNNGRTTDFLAKGSQGWVAGPEIPVLMDIGPCAVEISETSFLAIFGHNIREYQVDIGNPTTDVNWQEATKWPQLQTYRSFQFGCAKLEGNIIISGGWDGSERHRSTEILSLETRKIEFAGDLATTRTWLQMATIRTEEGTERVFAMGGWDGSSTESGVEELDPETLTWNPTSLNLLEGRSNFGKVVIPKKMICQG